MIRLEHLHVRVGAFDLRDISFSVPTGGYALIIGPTGSGKTTLLEAVAGTPDSARPGHHARRRCHGSPTRAPRTWLRVSAVSPLSAPHRAG